MYFTFVRLILKHADVIWDSIRLEQKQQLDKIQNEAARIVTRCSKLVSLDDLQKESDWEIIAYRRYKHRIILFYKMFHGLVPPYLISLIPSLLAKIQMIIYEIHKTYKIWSVELIFTGSRFLPTTSEN